MNYNFKATLDVKSLNKLANDLQDYAQNILTVKVENLVNILADKGISICYANVGQEYGSYIAFKKEVEVDGGKCTAYVIGEDTQKITRYWRKDGGTASAEISPLLMAEFGSGFKAKNPLDVSGVGQGTFPNQKHAFDPHGWWWTDLQGVTHHSEGESPTYPMYSAVLGLVYEINDAIYQAFG